MRLTRLLLPITLLAALALTSSAFAQGISYGEWNNWVIESYVTPWNSSTNEVDPDNPDYWHYDYIVWYESYAGSGNWAAPSDVLDYIYIEAPEFSNYFKAAGFFGLTSDGRTDSKVQLGTELHPSLYPFDFVSLGTTAYDNTDFQGTAEKITWQGYRNGVSAGGGNTINAYTWYIAKPDLDDADPDAYIDDAIQEAVDPAVRTVYFHNRPDSGSFSNSGLQAAWDAYINPIQHSSDSWATIQKEDAGVADNATWFPLNGNNPGGSSGDWGTYKADSGYNRPIAWVWLEFTAPPAPVDGWAKDGDISGNEVWGPTPELNPAFLLMLTLLPAGLLLRKRD